MDNENKDIVNYSDSSEEPADRQLPIESQIVKKNKGLSGKLAGALLSDDSQRVFSYIGREIISPALKKVLVESFKTLVYHGNTPESSSDSYVFTPYETLFDRGSESRPLRPSFGEIRFKSERDAQYVIDKMKAIIRKNTFVTVADYYKMAGHTPEHTYFDYGWTNLDSANTYHCKTKSGAAWCIHFPEPMYIEHRSR